MIMKEKFIFLNKNIFSIGLILLLAFSRLIPHPPNFTPLITVAIMSSYFFKNIYLSFFIILISMVLGDIFIGFYNNMFFVYLSLLLISYIFFKIIKKMNYKNLFVYALIGSLIFYLISNFGVWILGNLYEKNFNGLIECYIMAIPFLKNTIISTIFYSYLIYFSENKLRNLFKFA